MYQIRYTDGYDMTVTGDICRVTDRNEKQVFVGDHDACVAWLDARGCRSFAR